MPQPRKHGSQAQRQAAYQQRQREALKSLLQQKGLPALPAVPTIPGTARWRRAIESAVKFLATVEEEMQQYYSDRSEVWQESERAEEFQSRIDTVAEARGVVEELLTN